jgi:hypothetical protein
MGYRGVYILGGPRKRQNCFGSVCYVLSTIFGLCAMCVRCAEKWFLVCERCHVGRVPRVGHPVSMMRTFHSWPGKRARTASNCFLMFSAPHRLPSVWPS